MWVPHAWNPHVNETWVSWDRHRRNFLLCTMFVFLIFVREVFSLSLSVDTRQRLNYVNHWFSICVLFFFQVSFLSFTLFVLETFSQAYNNFYNQSLSFKLSLPRQNLKSILCGCFVLYHNASSPLLLEISNRQEFLFIYIYIFIIFFKLYWVWDILHQDL